jgi:hypothetical protein
MIFFATFNAGLQSAAGQMVSGRAMPGYGDVFGVDIRNDSDPYTCQFITSTAPGNVLWPGEQASFTFQLMNKSKDTLSGTGKVELIAYGTKGQPNTVWVPLVVSMGKLGTNSIDYNIAPGKTQDFTVTPQVPDKLGPYALVVDLGASGRRFVTTFVRTFKPIGDPPQYPQLTLDVGNVDVLTRLGACPNRMGIPFKSVEDPDFNQWMTTQSAKLDEFQKAKLPVLIEFGVGGGSATQPLGRDRPWLDDDGVMLVHKADAAWLPSYDEDFKKEVKLVLQKYGWPRGPIIAVKFQNEPWEGTSISGWGADMLRYRAIFKALAEATMEARKEYNEQVLLGGCDSSGNTMDKLFSDGSDEFLKYLDFSSIHYQGMCAPSTIKNWVGRTGPNGRVRIWDTESWVGNTDDRVAAVLATNLSCGYDRAVGVFGGNITSTNPERIVGADGKLQNIQQTQTWSVAASVGAVNHFIGLRKFREILFKNGLPWVFTFNGLPDNGQPNPEDGTVVVVGDIGEEFGHTLLLYRTAWGFPEIQHKQDLKAKLAALPADAPAADRADLEKQINTRETLSGGSMTLQADGDKFSLYDYYGNAVPTNNGQIVVPLDGRGFFLRGNGQPGSFAALLQAIKSSRVQGIEPLDKKVKDMLSPVDQPGSSFRLELTNVLNRPVQGKLKVEVQGLKLDPAEQDLQFAANETKVVKIGVSGTAQPNNTYPMKMTFDAGADGVSPWEEDLHVNQIAHRTIKIDGDLSDWNGVLPQTILPGTQTGPTLTEQAWLPFAKFDQNAAQGLSTGYLAYDDKYFYFAAKVSDSTPDGGTLRFAKEDEDKFFYPKVSYEYDPKKTLLKKDGTWTQPLREGGALFLPKSTTDRSFGDWQSVVGAFAVDLDLPADYKKVSFYSVDFDDNKNGRRRYWLEVQDRDSGKVLAHQEVAEYGNGRYLSFLMSGKVRVIFRAENGFGATLSGMFFDPAGAQAPHSPGGNAAVFLGADDKTGAAWQGNYGQDGYEIIGSAVQDPAYAKVNVPTVTSKIEHDWPDGVRTFSYRKAPILPSGGASPRFDNVQIAFNVFPPDSPEKRSMNHPPGTMPNYICYEDTDYEYALNKVSDAFGGGTEIWRLLVPGQPRKEFYPRQPKSPFDGPVADGKLVVVQNNTTRIEECAIPCSEIPGVKKCLDAGETIKFDFRVNDNSTTDCTELARNRSASRNNPYSFHPGWVEHWANELEFSFQK